MAVLLSFDIWYEIVKICLKSYKNYKKILKGKTEIFIKQIILTLLFREVVFE